MDPDSLLRIRPYDPAADAAALRACFVELQDWEHGIDRSLPEGEGIADEYLAEMLSECVASAGQVLVAEAAGCVVGFICVLAQVMPSKDEAQEPYAYISDMVVRAGHRGRGIGRRLIAEAEAFARAAGVRHLRVGVLATNDGAHRLYRDSGFADYTVELRKTLKG
jgi:ribosomal protein S18 acetylase RimI-like enzyme